MARKSNTRSASGSGSIRQRPDGRWEGRITVNVDGRSTRRSVYGDTQAEVRKKLTSIQRDIDRGVYQKPVKLTVGSWLDEWHATYCANSVKPLTLSAYRTVIERHLKPAFGSVELQALRGTHVQRLYNAMISEGLSPKTVKNTGAVLHKALSVALKQGIIPANPCDAAELPKMIHREISPLTDDEIPLFLAAIEGSPYRNAYALCLFGGLREGECLGLSWQQVDFTKRRITINQQLQKSKEKGGEYYIAPYTKSGKPRVIELPAIAFDYLKAERTRQIENRLKAGAVWSNPQDFVFTDELGDHFKVPTFYRHFKRIAASIGRPDARPHDLRHSAATVALASGADIKSVQDMLGHATASFTLNVYAHTSERMMEDTANRMQSYYDNLDIKRA